MVIVHSTLRFFLGKSITMAIFRRLETQRTPEVQLQRSPRVPGEPRLESSWRHRPERPGEAAAISEDIVLYLYVI